jgi:hypothetical protein
MHQILQDRVWQFFQKELVAQQLNGIVIKRLDKEVYKISNYRVKTDTATVEDSIGKSYKFLNSTTAVIYCCLMVTNRINEAVIVHNLNDELERAYEKIFRLKRRVRQATQDFDRDVAVARLAEYENQYTAKLEQLRKNIDQAKYIIKPGQTNGS